MASSSTTSCIPKSFRYDVFLSFAGEDTRYEFIGHLYRALTSNKIETYKDDEKIKKGERISDQLLKAIEDSRFHIIVFSKSYAASSWCLDELVKIMECHNNAEQTAYPLFFDVEPTEVRKQSGAVGVAFAKHENKEAANKWRDSLEEAAAIVGWELNKIDNGDESKLIQIIVEEIQQKLHSINFQVDGELVGMETRIKDFVSSLETDFDDVRMIGINGMGGAGKTTLARAVFDRISINFEGQSFVEDVREVSDSVSGLKSLQNQILSDVFNDPKLTVSSVSGGKNTMIQMMRCRKVLLVLDDVSDIKQLQALAGAPNWFKEGSRIIITTREEQVLVAHGVNSIRDVNLLTHGEAICLFSKNAFGGDIPIPEFQELSEKVVHYAAGLPLTIKVLGSLLRGAELLDWISALERLKTIPLHDTLQTLKLSYDSLEKDYKEIFLDVACILKGWKKDKAVEVLESCGLNARNGLRVLEQKSLITVSEYGSLGMHDHIEEMGKYIVRYLHPDEPNRHSRLWIQKEIEDILANNLDTDAIQCIKAGMFLACHPKTFTRGLANMKKLRVIDMSSISIFFSAGKVFNQCFPHALRYLNWDNYPFKSFLNSSQADHLVGLTLHGSNIVQFRKSGKTKVLNKLRFLDMSYSKLRTLDLEMTPNIEKLSLERCGYLKELNMPNRCPKLKFLRADSLRLKTLDLRLNSNLETLCLQDCRDLVELHMPNDCPMLGSFYLNGSNLRSLNLEATPNLHELDLSGCHELVELHVPPCPKLESLYLKCTKLRTLDLGLTSDLKILCLEGCRVLEELHMPNWWPNLKSLTLYNSKLRTLNLVHAPDLETLWLKGCHDLLEIHLPLQCPKLKSFSLNGSKLRTLDFRLTSDLETLSLEECCELVELHMPNEYPKLKYLSLKNSALRNLNLGPTLHLETLSLERCDDLVELHMPSECPKLKYLSLKNSALRKLNIGSTPDLETLSFERCDDLVELHMPFRCPKLSALTLYCSKLRTLDFGPTLDLETLSLERCDDLVELHMPNECPNLKSLSLRSSTLNHLSLGSSPNLETLWLQGCHDLLEVCMPFRCPKLKVLSFEYSKLRTLNLGHTPDLEALSLEGCCDLVELHMPFDCPKLKSLSLNNSKLRSLNLGLTPNLERLNIKECFNLVELRAPIGCLENLAYLDLSDCGGFKRFSFYKQIQSPVGSLHLIAKSINTCSLHSDSNLQKFRFSCLYGEPNPSSIGNLGKLISIGLCVCTNLESFSRSICDLRGLRKLTLEGSIPEVPKDLGRLESLEELSLLSTKIKHLPDSICMLKHLKLLELKSCWFVEKLPEDLGRLECLEELNLTGCIHLRDIPKSICDMKRLKCFHLPNCKLVEYLPWKLGRLECLKELNIEGTGISDLPDGIFGLQGLHIVASDGLSFTV